MSQISESCRLAARDWRFEFSISLCAVLALASMLAPLLILQGLKNGIIDGMRSRLLEDPATLIITPKSDAGRFSAQFIAELGKMPGARFAIGRTRDTTTDISVFNPMNNARESIAFEPAAPGEPVLEHYGATVPKDGQEPEIALSATAARILGADKGSVLEARVGRRTPQGRFETANIKLRVTAILPIEAADRKMAFAPLEFLEDMENYRDYLEVPRRNLTGRRLNAVRDYSSFRLYAANLDAVENLAARLGDLKIEVYTKAREIAGIKMLENAINQVVLIISLAVGAGFAAFTISSAQGAVSRKRRMLGMLRLLGFRRLALIIYPVIQTLLTALCGFLLSLLIYQGASFGIASAFSRQGVACSLNPGNIIFTLLAVALLSTLSCARASLMAASVEPSAVIREV